MDIENTAEWDTSLEELLGRYADEAQCRENLHRREFYKYRRVNKCFALPVIVLSALSGSFTFISKSYKNLEEIITNITGGVSILVAIISSVSSYLKLGENQSRHEVAEIAWQQLYNMVKHELGLRRDLRKDPREFLETVKVAYDRLFEISPIISQSVISIVKKQVRGHADFLVPNYLNGCSHTRAFDPGDD